MLGLRQDCLYLLLPLLWESQGCFQGQRSTKAKSHLPKIRESKGSYVVGQEGNPGPQCHVGLWNELSLCLIWKMGLMVLESQRFENNEKSLTTEQGGEPWDPSPGEAEAGGSVV